MVIEQRLNNEKLRIVVTSYSSSQELHFDRYVPVFISCKIERKDHYMALMVVLVGKNLKPTCQGEGLIWLTALSKSAHVLWR
jgi:hypothetical protein